MILAVRPEGIVMSTEAPTGAEPNEWPGEVITRSFLGDSVDHMVRAGGFDLRVRAPSNLSIPEETAVTLRIDPGNLSVIPG